MEITSFILGVLAVIMIMMVAITSVNYMTTKVLKKNIKELEDTTRSVFEDIYRRIGDVERDIHSRIDATEQSLVGHTDSRVDKLESKIYTDLDIKRQQSRQY